MFTAGQSISYGGNFGEEIERFNTGLDKSRKAVFLDGANFNVQPVFSKVVAQNMAPPVNVLQQSDTIVYDTLKPMLMLLRSMGIFPVGPITKGVYNITPVLMIYSVFLFTVLSVYIGYIQWDHVEIVKSAEGRFEEAVIGYLFTVYLIPYIVTPICWFEVRRLARVYSDWTIFEHIYTSVNHKRMPLFMGNKPMLISLALPILSCGTMVITHVTMVYFRFLHVIPYCYINTLTYLVGGVWYLHCDVIAHVAIIIAEDFEEALKHIGPSARVAEFRSLWMLLARITRDVGLGSCYVLTFLSLYLFLTITLTIYGLLSTLQDGIGIKDVGLCITAVFSIALLYFICDAAHYASNCVRVNFQKKLLMVELSWMNEDAQQELLATMVTYLVVLLQFQISIPEDNDPLNMTALIKTTTTTKAPK